MTTGYCVKCRKKQQMKNTIASTTKRGVKMLKGLCVICNTKMCKFGG